MAATLRDLKLASSQADPDVWLRIAGTHYDMILVYAEDILIFEKTPKVSLIELGKLYKLKPEGIKEPDIVPGANIEKVQMPNGSVEWVMGSKSYVKHAVKVVIY